MAAERLTDQNADDAGRWSAASLGGIDLVKGTGRGWSSPPSPPEVPPSGGSTSVAPVCPGGVAEWAGGSPECAVTRLALWSGASGDPGGGGSVQARSSPPRIGESGPRPIIWKGASPSSTPAHPSSTAARPSSNAALYGASPSIASASGSGPATRASRYQQAQSSSRTGAITIGHRPGRDQRQPLAADTSRAGRKRCRWGAPAATHAASR